MQWHDQQQQQTILQVNITDRVAIVGYQPNGSVTVRVLDGDKDLRYLNFLDECNAEAQRSPVAGNLMKDGKVWAHHKGQWYRARVEKVAGQTVTCQLLDLDMLMDVSKEQVRLLQSKELFFQPTLTRTYRLKNLRQKDIMSTQSVRNRLDLAIEKKEVFTVLDNANNYIELQIDGTPRSLNMYLVNLHERHEGVIEEVEAPPEIKMVTNDNQQVVTTMPMLMRLAKSSFSNICAMPPVL